MNKKILLLATATLLLVACEKESKEVENNKPEALTQTDVVNFYLSSPVALNGTFLETGSSMMRMNEASTGTRANSTSYPIVTWSPTDGTWPVDLMIDYGNEGVIASDGLKHSGKMSIHATGLFEKEGSIITPNFTNFYVYGNVLTATQIIENKGKNEAGNLVFDVKVENGLLSTQNPFIYSEQTQRELVNGLGENGYLSPEVTTHTYQITGWMKTESRIDSIAGYTITIDDQIPMRISVGDLYPQAGRVHIKFDQDLSYSFNGLEINYNSAILDFNGKEGDKYAATANIEFQFGPSTQSAEVSFQLDQNGIIPESITTNFELNTSGL